MNPCLPLPIARRGPARWLRTGALCVVLPLAASCGGGGGGGFPLLPTGQVAPTPAPGPGPGEPGRPADPPPAPALSVDCEGTHCGALAADRYAGSGVGIWRYVNDRPDTVQVPVSIQGVQGRELTLIYANPTAAPLPMPALRLEADAPAMARQAGPALSRIHAGVSHGPRAFDARKYLRQAGGARPAMRAAAPSSPAQVGQQRDWFAWEDDNSVSTRTIVLQRTVTAARGRVVNFWVEESEYGEGRVTPPMLEQIVQRFAQGPTQIYAMVTYVAGDPWGEHSYENLIEPSQPLDVVLYNFDRNGSPFGFSGMVSRVNNFRRVPDDEFLRYSNESLAMMMDTESLYMGEQHPLGPKIAVSAMAHELTHLINFYQRGVGMRDEAGQRDYQFADFLEETTGLMMQDLVDDRVDPDFSNLYYSYSDWLHVGLGNCSLTVWSGDPFADCTGYSSGASYGSFLLRHYGLAFYRGLLRNQSSTDSLAVLDDAIRQAGGPGFAETWRRWGTMAALLPHDASPAGFGMPERVLDDGRFWLPPVPRELFLPYRVWPSQLPSELAPHAQFPLRRTPTDDPYRELLPVPPGMALTVVVQ